MRPTRARFLSLAMALGTTMVLAQNLPEHRVHLPDGVRPPVLERASKVEGLIVLTLGAAGRRAAVATFVAEGSRSTVQLFTEGDDEPRILAMSGRVRDLQFSFDGDTVYALLANERKKRATDTQLMSIDFARAKSRSVMRVPPTAAAMDLWHGQSALLIASLDAVRTVTIPGLRSGPLFAVPGQNLAVASIGGTSRLLIGQSASLIEVDLDDPPGEFSLPIRDRVTTTQPVVALAAASDGGHALARMSDGALALVRFDPLRIREVGQAEAIAELEPRPAEKEVEFAPDNPVPEHAPPEELPPTLTEPAAAATVLIGDHGDAAPADLEPEAAPDQQPRAPESPEAGEAAEYRVHGRIGGPVADRVVAVVLLGPDNLLREAARVRPRADGRWEIHLTRPGRYRVQLDGGGDRVLVSEPSFRLIDLGEEEPPADLDFRVLRAI